MGSIGNYYRILDVPYDATFDEIKEAYRKKVKEVHPDKDKGNPEQFKKVKEAYETLKDVEKRKRYDNLLFKTAHNFRHNPKQESPAKINPFIRIVNIQNKNRKQDTLSPVFLNAALILIEVLGNAYLNKKK
ncbi:DnaJ domain-containing protein [Paenibacillus sp. BSR1-1]|uniref:J domain-containing protein n=1 Tax=Paenibacillus sp. BSR1-1 TaxID=3020845 RepID=UPI0025AF676A|nr:DnaJ domain-containing protein [Paenibacillus sp. BSR1-1]MDN3017983.1 DnaJ domain-containing protein [Paenibacillus sp. BSR1-1]